MRKVLLSGIIISFLALAYMPAFAQSSGNNPDTQRTDKSEDDWRKSKKKRNNTGPFNILKSPKGFGSNFPLPPMRPIDELPEESARHLKNLRAKAIATNSAGQKINADKTYTPSEAAKNDADLKAREKQVWQEMVKDMNGEGKNSQSDKNGKTDQNADKKSGQKMNKKTGGKTGDKNKNQAENSSKNSSENSSKNSSEKSGQNSANKGKQSDNTANRRGGNQSGSPLRGGSTSSAAEIMARIKGTGQNSQSQGSQSNTDSKNQSQKSNQTNNNTKSQSNSRQDKSQQNQAENKTKSQKPGNETNAETNADTNTDTAQNKKQKIILSPLELAKKPASERQTKCSTSSASAYIKNRNGRADNCD